MHHMMHFCHNITRLIQCLVKIISSPAFFPKIKLLINMANSNILYLLILMTNILMTRINFMLIQYITKIKSKKCKLLIIICVKVSKNKECKIVNYHNYSSLRIIILTELITKISIMISISIMVWLRWKEIRKFKICFWNILEKHI